MQNSQRETDSVKSSCAGTRRITAIDNSSVSANEIREVHAGRDVNIRHYGNPPAGRTEVPSKTEENIQRCQAELKSYLENQTKEQFQVAKSVSTPLDNIYTELYITEGGSGEVNSEHEVIELECKRSPKEEKKIPLNDLFKPLSDEENCPQRVLTKGIAGIGKTVAVQKFTHDWARGKANQDFQFVFPFTFRDLNPMKDESFSFQSLITGFHEEVTNLDSSDYKNASVLFILDGLDESTFPLDFKQNKICRSVTETTTVDVLLTNLIKGKLLHKASVWITSRPAAASKIPHEFINRVTEVRGFDDEQKKEYFKKEVKDELMAQKILDHLQSKQLRSLYIMCHIPLFCEISATVLKSLLKETYTHELPKTQTEMYTHFLIIQTKRKHQKDYREDETDKELIMKLGKLAFEELLKDNTIFYEEDIKRCHIDLKQAADYSGVCTKIIRIERGLHQKQIYSYIHLTVHEFLAALYVLETFLDSGENLLQSQTGVKVTSEKAELPIIFLHKKAVDKALEHSHGRWDMFLRFLLGLSQDKNQKLLQEELQFKGRSPQSCQQTITYIQEKIKKLLYFEKSINLFHCLTEMGDHCLVEQVQEYQRSGDLSKISASHWSALAYLLLVSNEDLDVFDLRKYHRSVVVLERLLPVLKVSKIALLSDCELTDRSVKHISSVLCSSSSRLEELDLSGNSVRDSGVQLLSEGLKNCKLLKLSLDHCGLTPGCCKSLFEALSCCSTLKELNLSDNHLKDQGVELLSDWLRTPQCKLEKLSLDHCGLTPDCCKSLSEALSCCSTLKELNLSRNIFLQDQGVELLSDWLRTPQCKLEKLSLGNCKLTPDCCKSLSEALSCCSTLKELNLSDNHLKDQGVELLSVGLRMPQCKLEKLGLELCMLTPGCCKSLSEALSCCSTLKELNLSRNHLEDQGVELLSDWLRMPQCKLEKLSLDDCSLTSGCCKSLSEALSCCSTLKELNLSNNILLKDQGVELLSDWLRRPQCKLEKLSLSYCSERACEFLASAIKANPSHLRELELRLSDPEDSGLKLLGDLKNDDRYKLQKITVS